MFEVRRRNIFIGNCLGKVWTCKTHESVVPAGSEPLFRGFVPTARSRRRKMEVGGEFRPSGQWLCSRHMKSRRIGEFGRLWACKKPLEVSLKVGSPWKLGGLGGERKCLHERLKVGPS